MGSIIDGVILTPLQMLDAPGGAVLHGIKNTDPGFAGFGEAYFSTIDYGAIKSWKRHLRMTLNLLVPAGEIRFVLLDERSDSPSLGKIQSICLSPEKNYQRLTVPPGLWMAFQGLFSPVSILLNVANLAHDPDEVERLPLNAFPYHWESRP
jgi:dTDP-4-dehydrorhamnose 3,5-epimerase